MANSYAVPADAIGSIDEQSKLDSNVAVYDDKTKYITCEAYEDFDNLSDPCNVEVAAAEDAGEDLVPAVNRYRDLIQRNVPLHPMQRFDTSDDVSDDADCPTHSTIVIERLEDVHEADDFDNYLMDVIAVDYVNKCPFRKPTMCGICKADSDRHEVFVTYMDLVEHTRTCHEAAGGPWQCCLCDSARVAQQTFEDQRAWKIHIWLVHSDLLEANVTLKCPTCANVFDSAVQFGKHICDLDSLPSADTTSCAECAATFVTDRRLKFHMLHRHPQTSCAGDGADAQTRQCVCLACGRTYADDQLFYEHVSFEHESYALFVCAVCDQCFTNGAECERHQRAHTAVRRYTCTECDARFVKRSHLNTHRHIHNPDRLHCDHCPKSFKRVTLLRQHINRMHIKFETQQLPFCSASGEVFTNADSTAQWREHLPCSCSKADRVVEPEPHSIGEFNELLCCEFCERAFGQADQLASHRQQCQSGQHRNNATDPGTSDEADLADDDGKSDRRSQFTCPLCHKTFDTFGKRTNHWRAHRDHPDLPSASAVRRCYVCDVADCGRRFVDWPKMQQHRKSGHLIGPTVMRCAECDAVFYQSWRLAHHRRVHHAERLRCPLCPTTFVQRSSLNAHTLRMHMNEQRPIAEVRSYRNRVIEKYFRVVPRDGSFTCRQCDKNVALRRNAITHAEAVHMRLRDFVCDHCEASFFGQNDLRKHMRRRHGAHAALVTGRGEPMECAYCGHRERSKVRLSAHMLREHAGKQNVDIGK